MGLAHTLDNYKAFKEKALCSVGSIQRYVGGCVMRKLIIVASIALLGVVGCGKSRNETLPMDSAAMAEAPPVIQPILLALRGQNSVKEFIEQKEGEEGVVTDEVQAKEKLIELSFSFSKLDKELTISDYSMKINNGKEVAEEIVDSKNSVALVTHYEEQKDADAILEIQIDRDMGEGKGIRYVFDGFLSDSSYKFQYIERSIVKTVQDEKEIWSEVSPQALFSGEIKLEKVVAEEKVEEGTKSEEPTVTEPTADTQNVEGEHLEAVGEQPKESEKGTSEGSTQDSSEGSVEESK